VTSVHAYFDATLAAFAAVAERLPITTRTFCIADRVVSIVCAGPQMARALFPALVHLEIDSATAERPDLRIVAWDGAESGVQPPPSALTAVADNSQGRVVDPVARVYGRFTAESGVLSLLDSATGTGIYWTRCAAALPTYVWGAPLSTLFHWWGSQRGMLMVHAGCIGEGERGLLLAGKGGSGKSTTSLLCLRAGLRYVSDDYCLVAFTPEPVAYSLYSVGKLTRDHLRNFPDLERISTDPNPDPFNKPVCFLAEHFPQQMAARLSPRAILLPRVTGQALTTIRPAPHMAALRALAPSSLFQLPDPSATTLAGLSRLAQTLPAAELHLGDLVTVVPTLRDYLMAT
jgi:hypothetical protein